MTLLRNPVLSAVKYSRLTRKYSWMPFLLRSTRVWWKYFVKVSSKPKTICSLHRVVFCGVIWFFGWCHVYVWEEIILLKGFVKFSSFKFMYTPALSQIILFTSWFRFVDYFLVSGCVVCWVCFKIFPEAANCLKGFESKGSKIKLWKLLFPTWKCNNIQLIPKLNH